MIKSILAGLLSLSLSTVAFAHSLEAGKTAPAKTSTTKTKSAKKPQLLRQGRAAGAAKSAKPAKATKSSTSSTAKSGTTPPATGNAVKTK